MAAVEMASSVLPTPADAFDQDRLLQVLRP